MRKSITNISTIFTLSAQSVSPLLCPAGNGTVQSQRADAVFGPVKVDPLHEGSLELLGALLTGEVHKKS